MPSNSEINSNASSTNSLLDLDSLFQNVNYGLFKAYKGESIRFFFKVKDPLERNKYHELVNSYGGYYVEHVKNIDSRTAILSEDLICTNKRPTFKLSYIIDCISQNSLLDITKYLHAKSRSSSKGSYMNVIFWRTEEFSLLEKLPSDATQRESKYSQSRHSENRDDSDLDSKISHSSYFKRTRAPYTMEEKEAILKFLIKYKRYTGLRGSQIFKKMERHNICPIRTYQSLKEHFAKVIVKELDRYSFLTEEQKKAFREPFMRL